VHYSHLVFIPENLDEINDEQGEEFHRHNDCWKAVPKQVDLTYVDGLLLDTEDGCT
jgi:hypothetical protein